VNIDDSYRVKWRLFGDYSSKMLWRWTWYLLWYDGLMKQRIHSLIWLFNRLERYDRYYVWLDLWRLAILWLDSPRM